MKYRDMKDMIQCSQESIDARLDITLKNGLLRRIAHCNSNGGYHWHTWLDREGGDVVSCSGRTITKAMAVAMADRHNLELPLLDTDAVGVGFWDGNGNRHVTAYTRVKDVRKALGQDIIDSLTRWNRDAREGHANPLAYKNERYGYFLVPPAFLDRNGGIEDLHLAWFRPNQSIEISTYAGSY